MDYAYAQPYQYRSAWRPSMLHRPRGGSHLDPRKVVKVPVTFVDSGKEHARPQKKSSEGTSREEKKSAAAVRIQAAVRGFLTRKKVGIVRKIQSEMEEIERRTSAEKEGLLRWDLKERLRLEEALMALLLRLDSVRGVRDYRKRVIRRVIALQELVDSISNESVREIAGKVSSTERVLENRHIDGSYETLDLTARSSSRGDAAVDKVESPAEEREAAMTEMIDIVIGESREEKKPTSAEPVSASRQIDGSCDEVADLAPRFAPEEPIDGASGESMNEESRTEYRIMETASVEDENPASSTESTPKKIAENLEETESAILDPIGGVSNELMDESKVEDGKLTSCENYQIKESYGIKDPEPRASVPAEAIRDPTAEAPAEGQKMVEAMAKVSRENRRLEEMVERLCERSLEQCRMIEGLAGRLAEVERAVGRIEASRRKRRSRRSYSLGE